MNNVLPPFLMTLAVLLSGAAVAALVLALIEMYQRFSQTYLATLGVDEGMIQATGKSPMAGTLLALRKTIIAVLAAINERSVPEKYLQRLRVQLIKAGHPLELSPPEIVALMELGSFSALAFGLFISLSPAVNFHPLLMLVLFVVGGMYPLIWLRDQVTRRQHLIVRALPYNLDLLTLSVEAGLDFAAAIGKVVEKGRKGPLADEFALTLRELKLGKTREEALRNLSNRCDIQTLTGFVNALIQADKMGTPLGKILRILSTAMRNERTQRAEKLANEAPVKMLAPLIGFIFPTIFLILFAPIIFSVMQVR